ncbi:nucleoside deaminase [Streptomyces sp. NPDC088766]|uniref:nucleoside deaminase n=1 Tax=Streptomyces sp. NPDC088766 TaxID=3365893 RepID=UPI0037F47F62
MVKDDEVPPPRRRVVLAEEASRAGDGPFGSVLVGAEGAVLAEDHNRVASGDRTRHPEFEPARWSAAHLSPGERAAATVYTSGEHRPTCAAAHSRIGLGRIVYAASSARLTTWLSGWGVPAAPVRALPVQEIAPGVPVEGPVPGPAREMRAPHRRFHGVRAEPERP